MYESLKLHFLISGVDHFSENSDDYNEEEENRFHQDIHMEERYQVW